MEDDILRTVSELIEDKERLLFLINDGIVPALTLIQSGMDRFDELYFERKLTGFLIRLLGDRENIDVLNDCELLTSVMNALKSPQKVG